jgi:PAS domain S-box-containing protein
MTTTEPTGFEDVGVSWPERRLRAQYGIVKVLAESPTLADATPKILSAIGENLGWAVTALWRLEPQTKVLQCVDVWTAPGINARAFEALTREISLPIGVGLPGRVWATGDPMWIEDISEDEGRPRGPIAATDGLRSGFAFPIMLGGQFLGAIDSWHTERLAPDEELLEMMAAIGSMVGQFIERKQTEEAMRTSEARKTAMFESSLDAIISMDHEGNVVEYNPSAERIFGYPRDEILGKPLADFIIPSELRDKHWQGLQRYLETGKARILGKRMELKAVRADGSEFPVEVTISPVDVDGPPLFTGFIRDITHRKESEREVAELLIRQQQAQSATEIAQKRFEFLAEASMQLASSLDYRSRLESLARLAVPYLADWCVVHVVEEEGRIHPVVVQHAFAEDQELGVELYKARLDPASRFSVHEVVRTGNPLIVPEVEPEMLDNVAGAPEARALLDKMEVSSVIIVPLSARGRTVGTLTFISTRSERNYTEQDLALAEDLSRHAAVMIDNARLYQERTAVARTLQKSLLPPALPTIPGVELAARYEPAGEGNEVGGDFFDVFLYGENRWAIVIGDVCGKGAEAAALTGLARYTLRAAAMQMQTPAQMLEMLNEAILQQRTDERFATVALGTLWFDDEGQATVSLACGGHPPPMLMRSDGTVEAVGAAGMLLGLFPDVELNEDAVRLEAGDTLIFYTDGVPEARDDGGLLGQTGLRKLISGCAGLDAVKCADQIREQVMAIQGGRARDDVAIVVLRISPRGAKSAPVLTPMLTRDISGGFKAPGESRRALEAIAAELPPKLFETVMFLTNELVTNSVRHAKVSNEDTIGIRVLTSPETIRVEVRDPGEGFDPQPREPDADQSSGWGLHILDQEATRWGVTNDTDTCVWFEIDRPQENFGEDSVPL